MTLPLTVIVGILDAGRAVFVTAQHTPAGPRIGPSRYFTANSPADLTTLLRRYQAQHARRASAALIILDPPTGAGQAAASFSTSDPGIPVRLLAPAHALAAAIPLLAPADSLILQAGAPGSGHCALALVAGRSLDSALLVSAGAALVVLPTAGGHCAFAPTSIADVDLFHFLQDRQGYADYAAICTFTGLFTLYEYLRQVGFAVESAWVAAALDGAADKAAVILAAARQAERSCSLCREAVERLALALGAHAAMLALASGARGGVYLGGALSTAIGWALEGQWFRAAFRQRGPARELLTSTPLWLVPGEAALLRGAAAIGLGLA